MAYKVVVSPRAQKEIKNAIDYYALYSQNAPLSFIAFLEIAYDTLSVTPFFKVRYKEVRALKIKKIPYSLYFKVDEEQNLVHVLSCFHNRRHPDKRPE
jgi:toxin ParE1/3/4